MAFISDYAGQEALGEWYTVGYDEARHASVQMRIRPLDSETRRGIERKYRRLSKIKGTAQRQPVIPPDKLPHIIDDQCVYMWTDTKNYWIKIETEKAAHFYQQELGAKQVTIVAGASKPAGELAPGDEFLVDGYLTEAIKRRQLSLNSSFSSLILEKGQAISEEEIAEEEALTENLPSGSTSASAKIEV